MQPVDDIQLDSVKFVEAIKSDTEIIATVTACISEGINTKMKLVDAAAERTNISKRSAQQIIEKYTGSDPTLHRWNFSRGERGAQVFTVLSEAHLEALVIPPEDVPLAISPSPESLTI